ncbi:sensor histidine kinase [Pseudonocardia kunmingensis]|uniref:sensor histidine kinase n=1 Tax=Pseudonocardia kunmingensis TaxID=630975 RepID=UPI00147824B6|nr:histidine kinase [Pseudonocardia kunmingensis]
MDATPLLGPEERKVRAARRFGRIGLAMTIFWLLTVPAYGVWLAGLDLVSGWYLFVLYVVAFGLHLWRIRQHMAALGARAPWWFVVVATVVGIAITLLGLATGYPGFIWSLVGGVLLGDVVAGLRARWMMLWIGLATAFTLVAGYLLTAPSLVGTPISPWFPAGCAAFFVATMWTLDVERLWWLKAVTDLDDSRRTAAELATARERLRLADDLHDILGHALEVVAFKSELAARLQEGDPVRARVEMEEVQAVARRSLSEVRALVRDTRPTDLGTELAGARAVLETAGVDLVVRGDPAGVGPAAGNVLGRVLREAMTNVLRHSEPSRCTIEIDATGGQARLRVVNDGALPGDDADPGTGLAALGRYLQEHAGRLEARPGPDGTFRLDAELPAGVS